MKIAPREIIGPLVAALVLVLTVHQTLDALHRAGLWTNSRRLAPLQAADPYARLDQAIARANATGSGTGVRDPFVFGYVPVVAVDHAVRIHVVKPPPPPPLPVLTAIIWDNDPRALIRLDGREYTIHSGGLFAEYRVASITRNQVTLEKDGQSLVLNRPLKGD